MQVVFSQSLLDISVFYLTTLAALATIVAFIWSSGPVKSQRLHSISLQLNELKIGGLGRATTKRISKITKYMTVLSLFVMVGLFIGAYGYVDDKFFSRAGSRSDPLHWTLVVLNALLPYFGSINPLVFSTNCLAIFLLGCLVEGLLELEKIAKESPEDESQGGGRSSSLEHWRRVAEMGKKLDLLQRDVAAALSFDLLVVCGEYLVRFLSFPGC